MANNSSTGEYLLPTTPPPPQGLDLDILIQAVIVGITGLPAPMVRPRVQPNDPQTGSPVAPIPNADVDWCAVGISLVTPDDTPAQIHHPDGDGYTILRTVHRLDVLASFYGPCSDGYARLARDAFYVAQNREAMRADGLNFVGCDPIRAIPAIVNAGNRRRSDLPFQLLQVIERRYEIRNVRSLDGQIVASGGRPTGPALVTNPLSTTPPDGA